MLRPCGQGMLESATDASIWKDVVGEKGAFYVGKWQSQGLRAGKHRTPGMSED